MPPVHGARRLAAFRLTLACDLAEVRPASREVTSFFASQGCDESELMASGLAVVEACNNAIKYAPLESRSLPILIEALASDDSIEVRVTDHTHGFEWPAQFELPSPDSESGRGLFLIHSLTDSAGYFRGPTENVLHFKRRRTSVALESPVAASAPELQAKLAEQDRVIAQMVDELTSCYESLSAIFRHAHAAQESSQLKNYAGPLLHDLLRIVGAEWFLLRLASQNQAELVVFATSDPTLELDPLQLSPNEAPINCAEVEAAVTRRDVWFDTRTPAGNIDPIAHAKPAAQGLVHPVCVGEHLIGTLTVGRNASQSEAPVLQPPAVFTAGQASVIGMLADFFGLQVINARSAEEQTQSRLLARELEIATDIQHSLLLRRLPAVAGIDIAARCENARQVGGDFYDVLSAGDSALLLIIADVMGKGVPAAMFAAILRTALRASPELLQQPASLLTRANQLLFEDLSAVDMFITAQLALVRADERTLTLASAGHCPLLLSTNQAPGFQALSPEGMPLGIQRDVVFQEQTIALGRSFRALLYTDGLTEALNPEGKRYGQENAECWFAATAGQCRTANDLCLALEQEMIRFRAGLALNDDQTYITMSSNSTT